MAAYTYDCNILYNYAQSPLSKTHDTILSLQFVYRLVNECERHDFKCYYHDRDALPGKIMFEELTEVIESSRYTILIMTKDFVKDCYAKYKKFTALKMLFDEQRIDKLIPVAISLEQVPKDIAIYIPEHFLADSWDTDESKLSWRKLINRLIDQKDEVIYRRNNAAVQGNEVIYRRNNAAVQERGDNQQRTDINDTMVAEETCSIIVSSCDVPQDSSSLTQDRDLEIDVPIPTQGSTDSGCSQDNQEALNQTQHLDMTSNTPMEEQAKIEAPTLQTNNGQVGSEGSRDKGLLRTLFEYILAYDG